MPDFQLVSPYEPAGDQPAAIEALVRGVRDDKPHQTLLGVTGSGKTFTMANVIAQLGRPALVMSHNKTLAAQLYGEFKEFFPHNAVRYFVSYYDYYQPEAYIPQRDIYIEKDSSINEEIERLRLATTSALVSRNDVIVIASVSCIYGLGSPDDYKKLMVKLAVGQTIDRDEMLLRFVEIQYDRNDIDFSRGKFRVRGDVVELWPAYEEVGFRIELFGDEVESLAVIDPTSGAVIEKKEEMYIYPAKHFVMPEDRIKGAVDAINEELEQRLQQFKEQGKLLEAQRLAARTRYDVEMLLEVGHCSGIENYSRHLSGRKGGDTPNTLIDFFPEDSLLFIDESHVSLGQIRGMFAGDFSRKSTLVEHGFRLPSALDNRPLRFDEWEKKLGQRIYVTATPGDYEVTMSGGEVVEQVIRPTGLLDPLVRVEPARGQVPALLIEAKKRSEKGERVLVTTLTKRLAEDLSRFLVEQGLKCKWLHSELDAFERVTILRELREGGFDVLVGVNLLREGLDLPEVSMVCILDADKEGFLRSETSLIQTIGRAARHVNAEVVLYADTVTKSMQRAIDETTRRRALQLAYNTEKGITPETIKKAIRRGIEEEIQAKSEVRKALGRDEATDANEDYMNELEAEMLKAAENLEFERAAAIRDRIMQLKAGKSGGKARPNASRPGHQRPGQGQGRRQRQEGPPPAQAPLTHPTEAPMPAIDFGPAERANAETLIPLALAEDLGEAGDLTGKFTIPAAAMGSARFVARSPGVLAGMPVLRLLAERFGLDLGLACFRKDGDRLEPGAMIAGVGGSMRPLLAMERTALNFLQRLGGVATLTARFVAEVAGTKAVILDTRKTTPGWRALEKYAVRCGGGTNHRIGLHDAVLIKDNHLAWLESGGDPIGRAVGEARRLAPPGTKFIEVEVDTMGQLDRALEVGPDIILVDNLGPDLMAEAVRRRDARAPGVLLEASGGVSLETVGALARSGVDRISVGALTHSAPSLDIGLDFDRALPA